VRLAAQPAAAPPSPSFALFAVTSRAGRAPDTAVVLTYHTGGTANWDSVYCFRMAEGAPQLIG